MNKKLLSFVSLLFLLVSSAMSFAAISQSTVLVVMHALQVGAPLEITSSEKTLSDAISSVTVRNTSNKTIESYQLAWIETLPSGCSASSMKPSIARGKTQGPVKPLGTSTSGPYNLLVSGLIAEARAHQAKLIYVQVGVASVTYSDGSFWNYDPSEESLFDTWLRDELSKQCVSGDLLAEHHITDSQGAPEVHFFCRTQPGLPVFCTNHNTSCTTTNCPNPHECADQICDFNIP